MPDASTLTMHDLIAIGFDLKASDVYAKADSVPMMKQFSLIRKLDDGLPMLKGEDVMRMCRELMNDRQKRIFDETFEMDLAFAVGDKCRVRCNIYKQKGHY